MEHYFYYNELIIFILLLIGALYIIVRQYFSMYKHRCDDNYNKHNSELQISNIIKLIMGIKSLTQIIKRECPKGIKHESLSSLSGKKVAVDASLIIYQQLLRHQLLKNKKGEIRSKDT